MTNAGYIIRKIEDNSSEMAIAYERSIGCHKIDLMSKRATLICPRGASRLEVRPKSTRQHFNATATQVLYIPPGVKVVMHGMSAVMDVLALSPSSNYLSAVITDNFLGADEENGLATQIYSLRRSRWMDDLIERYFFERVDNNKSPQGCTYFLEKQMLNELVRLIFVDKVPTTGDMLGDEISDLALRALQFIEDNLFENIDIAAICRVTGSTEPTLARAFKKRFGLTPGTYLKDRRLDEAAIMIERGDHRVGDVAMILGYNELGSFSRAFKERFGDTPRTYQKVIEKKRNREE
jgi:AraC-like DNA-binding protein